MRPPTIIVSLVHIQGPLKGEIQEFSQETIQVGRHPSNDVRFPPDLIIVSRYHAEITREGNRFRLMNKGRNGTFVNGKKVAETFLKDGDVIEFAEGGPKVSFLSQITEERATDEESGLFQAAPPPPPREPTRRLPDIAPPVARPAPPSAPPAAYSPSERQRPSASASYREEPDHGPAVQAEVSAAPLIIQYGPTVRSYRQVPVTIGRNPKCGFALDHPGILEQHAEIFHGRGQYWIKDLTGQGLVQLNMRPLSGQNPLTPNDIITLSPEGPSFRFVGEGRLAEVEEQPRPAETSASQAKDAAGIAAPGSKGGVFSRVKKKLF